MRRFKSYKEALKWLRKNVDASCSVLIGDVVYRWGQEPAFFATGEYYLTKT